MASKQLDAFTAAYIEAAFFTTNEDFTVDELAEETRDVMIDDCADFQKSFGELMKGLDPVQCGHDFWLTRNHHGAGFWDRGLGEVGEKLTEMAHAYGEADLYEGDDGLIYSNDNHNSERRANARLKG